MPAYSTQSLERTFIKKLWPFSVLVDEIALSDRHVDISG